MSVALSILGCYGICATIGLIFSPMHGIVPFLILGTYKPKMIYRLKRHIF